MSTELIVAIVGIVVAVASIMVSIVIARHYRDRRELSYETLLTPKLLSVDEAIREGISIKYEGRDVKDLAGITVTIRSTGNRAIRFPTDDARYEEPVTIHFGEGTEVIGMPRVTKTEPDSLDASLEIIDSSTVKLNPLLLNPGECISIFALLTNLRDEVKVNGHIEDTPPIKEIQPSSAGRASEVIIGLFTYSLVFLVLTAGVGFAVGWLFLPDDPKMGIPLTWGIIAFLGVPATLLYLFVGLIRWLWNKREQRSSRA